MKARLPIILVVLALVVIGALAYVLSNPTLIKTDSISELPLPGNVSNYTKLTDNMITFETDMELPDVLVFYQDMLGKKGYSERTTVTYVEETGFGAVFDGHISGYEIIVQGALLGDYHSMTLRFQDIDT